MLHTEFAEGGASTRVARMAQKATRLASMPECGCARKARRGAEQFAGVFGGDGLDLVDVLTPGVEAVADRSLRIFVRQPAAHGEQDRREA